MAQVDVEVPGLAPHRGVARRRSHARVRPGIGHGAGAEPVVRLDLGEPHGHRLAVDRRREVRAEEARRDLDGQPGEVGARRGTEVAGAHEGGT